MSTHKNHGFDPFEAFLKLPADKIRQIHLAGHKNYSTHLVDTHSESIQPPVLKLFRRITKEIGTVPVTVERDDNIPAFEEMMNEIARVEACYG